MIGTKNDIILSDNELEKKEIINRYRRLLRKARFVLGDGDTRIIKKAFVIAAEAHRNMQRKSGEPYIFHPLSVAEICVEEIGLGTTAIVAALLHDVVEDTHITIEFIESSFGKKIAKIVDGLTKVRGVFEYGSSAQAENFRKILFTLSEDIRVMLIKLADRLHNMRTLSSMPRNKQLRVASETIYLYAPLAHRLGLNNIKTELEDLYLSFTEPAVYKEISDNIRATRVPRNRFIAQFIKPIRKKLVPLKIKYEIKGRLKSVYSIYNKMKKQNIPFDQVYDLFAIRIVLQAPTDNEKSICWQAYSKVTDCYTPNPDRLRDWISAPKENGYESLHTTVMAKNGHWVEVQIRTQRMDEIAEKGYAAHWKYKESASGRESKLEKWLMRVGELLKQGDRDALEFIDDFRLNLYNEEIIVFTPKGELKTLPKGASALDFAFEIHTDVGAACIGAKVNQKLVPINQKLKNGDQVEVLTSSRQKPSAAWLQIVVTSKAKSRIKDFLKQDHKIAAQNGKEILERKMRLLKMDTSPQNMDNLRAYFKAESLFDLHYRIGNGNITAKELRKFKAQKIAPSPVKTVSKIKKMDVKTVQKTISEKRHGEDTLLIGEDMNLLGYTLATCCKPIQGDEVFGFITVSEGIKIHRTSCPNAPELMSNHGHRIIKAKWTSQHELSFLTGIKVSGTDRIGLVNDITKIVAKELQVNINSLVFDVKDGIFSGEIMVFVNDTRHLEILIEKIKNIEGVVHIQRFESGGVSA